MDGEQGYFWSTYSGAELDLLLLIDGRRIGIECKYSEAPKATKSMHSALHHLQLDILYIAYPGADDFPLTDKITVRSLPSLLTEYS